MILRYVKKEKPDGFSFFFAPTAMSYWSQVASWLRILSGCSIINKEVSVNKSIVFLFCLVTAGLFSTAHAEEGTELCRDDVQKFCKDIKPGDARIMHCLKEHHDQLSPACKAKGTEMREKMQEMRKEMGDDLMGGQHGACKADMEKFCKDVKPGEGRVMECMKSHKSELSKGCTEMHEKMKGKMKEHMKGMRGMKHHGGDEKADKAPEAAPAKTDGK